MGPLTADGARWLQFHFDVNIFQFSFCWPLRCSGTRVPLSAIYSTLALSRRFGSIQHNSQQTVVFFSFPQTAQHSDYQMDFVMISEVLVDFSLHPKIVNIFIRLRVAWNISLGECNAIHGTVFLITIGDKLQDKLHSVTAPLRVSRSADKRFYSA
jgi:hypothetical protein